MFLKLCISHALIFTVGTCISSNTKVRLHTAVSLELIRVWCPVQGHFMCLAAGRAVYFIKLKYCHPFDLKMSVPLVTEVGLG